MGRFSAFYKELGQRRVIRTTLVYLALAWAVIEAADLLTGAALLPVAWMPWIFSALAVGLPLTIGLSWFLDLPWRSSRGQAVLGDVVIILAVSIVAVLFAWQQLFSSLVRPAVAVIRIEPTDTREDSQWLAVHLERRLRMLLSTRPELVVLELSSSLHAGLDELSLAEKATALGADYLLTGTVNQGEQRVRLNLQLFDMDGGLVWSERYEENLLDQSQLQSRVINGLWPELPLPGNAAAESRKLVSDCAYPQDVSVLQRLFKAAVDSGREPRLAVDALNPLIESHTAGGLLHLERARAYFSALPTESAARQPVIHNLAMADLRRGEELCPGFPDIEILHAQHTLQVEMGSEALEDLLVRHPNDAGVLLMAARVYQSLHQPDTALALGEAALRLDPFGAATVCGIRTLRGTLDDGGSHEQSESVGGLYAGLPGSPIPDCP